METCPRARVFEFQNSYFSGCPRNTSKSILAADIHAPIRSPLPRDPLHLAEAKTKSKTETKIGMKKGRGEGEKMGEKSRLVTQFHLPLPLGYRWNWQFFEIAMRHSGSDDHSSNRRVAVAYAIYAARLYICIHIAAEG